MRIRSWLMLGIGYLAGSRAGREKFEELRGTVRDLASSDATNEIVNKVRDTLGLPESVFGKSGQGGEGGQGNGGQDRSGWQQEEGAWVPDGDQESGGGEGSSGGAEQGSSEQNQHADTSTRS